MMLSNLIWRLAGPRVPRVELARLRGVDFFPPWPGPERLKQMKRICIGTKNRTLGDALMLSTLPGKLKQAYPHLRVEVYPRGFTPVVFYGNPAVTGVNYTPRQLFGDDCKLDSGHVIELKENFFGLAVSERTRPEIHLSPKEKLRLPRPELPLCILHPWGKTRSKVSSALLWEEVIRRWRNDFCFWQVGVEGQSRLQGCERHFLLPRGFRHARRLFSILSQGDAFIGVDSAPMHVARAFDVSSLIFTDLGIPPGELFLSRYQEPYFRPLNTLAGFLYEDNRHVDVKLASFTEVLGQVDLFLEERRRSYS